jgi:hypothetical protein
MSTASAALPLQERVLKLVKVSLQFRWCLWSHRTQSDLFCLDGVESTICLVSWTRYRLSRDIVLLFFTDHFQEQPPCILNSLFGCIGILWSSRVQIPRGEYLDAIRVSDLGAVVIDLNLPYSAYRSHKPTLLTYKGWCSMKTSNISCWPFIGTAISLLLVSIWNHHVRGFWRFDKS